MSVHIDVPASESCERTSSPQPPSHPQPARRVTIFEREEVIQGMSAVTIMAVQKEIVEMREEFEKKMLEAQERHTRQLVELLTIAARERLDIERLKLSFTTQQQNSGADDEESWETASDSSSKKK